MSQKSPAPAGRAAAAKPPAERVVRDIRRRTRKQHSTEEKIRVVLEGLRGEESIAALCRREGIAESLYYAWSKEFLEAGKRRLEGDTARAATTDEVKALRQEARRSISATPPQSSPEPRAGEGAGDPGSRGGAIAPAPTPRGGPRHDADGGGRNRRSRMASAARTRACRSAGRPAMCCGGAAANSRRSASSGPASRRGLVPSSSRAERAASRAAASPMCGRSRSRAKATISAVATARLHRSSCKSGSKSMRRAPRSDFVRA